MLEELQTKHTSKHAGSKALSGLIILSKASLAMVVGRAALKWPQVRQEAGMMVFQIIAAEKLGPHSAAMMAVFVTQKKCTFCPGVLIVRTTLAAMELHQRSRI